jgi:hypothetical protein
MGIEGLVGMGSKDRVMDGPALRDVLAWDSNLGQRPFDSVQMVDLSC